MRRRGILIIGIISMAIFLTSCFNKEEKSSGFKVYYNKNTVQEIKEIKEVAAKYEKVKSGKIEFIGVMDEEEILQYTGEDKDASIILLDGYSFMEFVNKDAVRDLNYLYKEKDTREKFSIITNIYGRDGGKYYGIGLMPFSLELVCNREKIESMGISLEKNNLNEVILKLREKGIKIPTYIKSEYSKELLLSALVANDTIIYEINKSEITGVLQEKINTIKNGQEIFDYIHKFYMEGSFRADNFTNEGSEAIEKFNRGEIPVLLTTTLVSDRLTGKLKTTVINKLPIKNKFVGAPVGIDIIITSSVGKNKIEEVDGFLRYLIQGKGIEELSKKNIITGNKKGDSSLMGVQGQMAATIESADEINKLYFNIISNRDIWKIDKSIKAVMEGKYTGQEWKDILAKK